jgi:hypothetical protein
MSIDIATLASIALLVTALVLQVLATLRVKRDGGSTPEQKGLQLRLIWLLPLVGAALVLAVLHEEPRSSHSVNRGQESEGAHDRAKPSARQRRPS